MQPQPQAGPPSTCPTRIRYAKAGESPRSNVDQFLEMVATQDPMRAAQFSLFYGIRNRIDQVTIAVIFVNFMLVFVLAALVLLR